MKVRHSQRRLLAGRPKCSRRREGEGKVGVHGFVWISVMDHVIQIP
jgi:hypothetical protein